MKTKNLIRSLFLALFLMTFSHCGEENTLWIEPGVTYIIEGFLQKNSVGTLDDITRNLFPNVKKITFQKFHPLGKKGYGEMKFFYSEDVLQETPIYEVVYYDWCTCYDYKTSVVQEVVSVKTENTYTFSWVQESQKKISLDFSKYAPIIQGTTWISLFLKSINQTYTVSKDAEKKGTLYAGRIVLLNENGDRAIVLKRQ